MKVSIAMTTYNGEKYVEEQLKIGKIMQEDIEQSRKKENSISNEEKAIDDIEMD